MVVRCDEGVGDVYAVVPGLMPAGEDAAGGGVQDVEMDVVLQNLLHPHHIVRNVSSIKDRAR